MHEIVDARGLSCPQPVLEVLRHIRAGRVETLEVLVDTDTAKENVIRAARSQGWGVKEVSPEETGYRITVVKA
ncbi:sulfurtransferase TusA family protein [Deferrisoma sp.]